jgi:hypothetical protein
MKHIVGVEDFQPPESQCIWGGVKIFNPQNRNAYPWVEDFQPLRFTD